MQWVTNMYEIGEAHAYIDITKNYSTSSSGSLVTYDVVCDS